MAMSREIKIQQAPTEKSILELKTMIEELHKDIGETINGNKQIKMVDAYNEIKEEYESILSDYITLFQNNVNATEQAVKDMIELDHKLSEHIRID
ncbi:hypothetical protein AQ616_01970 [Oceanobacillus sp. E9]|nr:hypothetical protein AQ616_01970 [Oceanobacillus sp. E9]